MNPQTGETVRVHYRGTLSDGSEFDSSAGSDPLTFTLGEESVIPGFEAAVAGLAVGESATVTIPSDEAYGERHPEAVQNVPMDIFADMEPEVGMVIGVQSPDGQQMAATIAEVLDGHVVLDFNHPLSGQDLTFELSLVEIVGR
ncbi:MAG: peptidylprolyl isomerase [Coriobacteriia bacterium]|nr:peptidylprolyl isomerase [Coriobacteriia bacterium]